MDGVNRHAFVEVGAGRCQTGVTLRDRIPPRLGVSEERAYADLLLINGDPLKDTAVLTKPEESFAQIMEDGKISKEQH